MDTWTNDRTFNFNNALMAVRISDNVLDDTDWGIDIINVKEGVVVKQTNVYEGCYTLPDMVGWTMFELFAWLNEDFTGSHPENYHSMKVIENFM